MSEQAVRDAFRDQARSCRMLGSDYTAALCEALADLLQPDQGAVAARVLNWPGDPRSSADSVPLRLCGALHALVLTDAAPELARAYAARRVDPGLLLAALKDHEATVLRWMDSPPQTNEVARSAAILAAARYLHGLNPLPLRVLELGASAGLNLNFHRYELAPNTEFLESESVVLRPEWQGDLPEGDPVVDSAEGVDLNPLDPVADALRLRAYCWADQVARLSRLNAALALAQRHPPQVTAGDAAGWLATRLAEKAPGRLTLVTHTIAAQYFPAETLAACEAAMDAAGRAATPQMPVAHFSMESDGGADGARLTLRLWDGQQRGWYLGRADFHGRWIRWAPVPLTPDEVQNAGLGLFGRRM
ncbi:DUF2332 family protein [Paracoccus caeni]|uniref:DUF2332 family protein n=1 Tax=Paracoccus caeni TaxID=657651 RepID=A0A934W0D0_9RHOB|nr:DUF2332 family protein [Paracoccus caeni]MBK4215684.1 DUF2332 family protein [Paracoccus caeni]